MITFALDFATTAWAFSLGAIEANPLMAGWPLWKIGAAKFLVLGLVLWCADRGTMAKIVHGYGATVTAGAVVWNLYGIVAYGL